MAKGNANVSKGSTGWTNTQAYVISGICLLLGMAAGYLLRGSAGPQASPVAATSTAPTATAPAPPGTGGMQQQITPEQLKQMADSQAAPLVRRLKSEPNNAQLLADVGNLYYDAQQFRLALDYYQRSLKLQPGNSNVRVDLGTAMWYLGDADSAIEQYKTVLKTEPTKPNALMNLGVVEWQGKMNVPAAVAAWEKLLATNPDFQGKDRVQRLIVQAKRHSNMQLGGKTAKPSM